MEGDLLYVGIMSTSAKGVRGQFVYYAGGAIFRLTTYYPSSYVVATPRDHCRTIGDYQVGATWRDIVISGDLAYVVGDRLLVLDISTRSDPTVVAEFPLERPGIHAGVSGGYVYIAYDDGVYALDVTDPANPVPAGDCKAGTGNRCLVADGDHVYLGGSSGLYVLQLSPEAVADVQQEAEIVPMDVAWDGQRLVLVEEFTASW